MTASIRHRIEQELRASQLHPCSTKLPSKSKTNPSIDDSDSDFDTKHHFKHPHSGWIWWCKQVQNWGNYSLAMGWARPHTTVSSAAWSHIPDGTLSRASQIFLQWHGAPKVCFQAHFRVNLQNEEQVKHWLHASRVIANARIVLHAHTVVSR